MSTLNKPRKKRSVRIRLDLYEWIEEQIERGKLQSFSHAVDVAVEKLKDSEKE